jgi:hypothetical protein
MSKQPKKLDVNDFWNDCLIDENPSKNSDNIQLNSLFKNNPRSKRNKKLYRYDTNPSFSSSKIIQNALISEENTKAENDKLLHESIEYMVSLYNKAMLSNEKKKKNIILTNEKKLNMEKKICSFKPMKFTSNYQQKKFSKTFGNSNIYERGLEFQQRRMAKMAKLFEQNNKKNNIPYSFHPSITTKNLNKVFYSNNYCKEQADNDSNKIFLSRLMKAREEEQYKKNCLENKVRKKKDYSMYYKRLKKSLSQKDSLLYRNNLHKDILSLKCFPTNNDKENENGDDFLFI